MDDLSLLLHITRSNDIFFTDKKKNKINRKNKLMFQKVQDSFANVFMLKAMLRCYELGLGLEVNFHKSKLIGINVERQAIEVYKSLHFTIMNVPFKYPGLEVGANPRKKLFWNQL